MTTNLLKQINIIYTPKTNKQEKEKTMLPKEKKSKLMDIHTDHATIL